MSRMHPGFLLKLGGGNDPLNTSAGAVLIDRETLVDSILINTDYPTGVSSSITSTIS